MSSKDGILLDYGKTLIDMINNTNLIVLNGIKVFHLTIALTCLLALGRGSVVDYVFMKACDLSMVNAFNIGPLFLNLDHNLVYFDLTLSHSFNKYSKMK